MSDRRDPTLDLPSSSASPRARPHCPASSWTPNRVRATYYDFAHHDEFGVGPVVLIGTQASG